jgi:hypothetical protein
VVLRAFFPLETEHAGVACSISVSGGGRNTSDMTEENTAGAATPRKRKGIAAAVMRMHAPIVIMIRGTGVEMW